jgi:predicted Zn-dependent protease
LETLLNAALRHQEAAECLREAVELEPQADEAWFQLARAKSELADVEQARAAAAEVSTRPGPA